MSIRTGAAQTDITPAGPVWMAGYGDRDRRSEGVYQPLGAGAIYLGGAADEVVLIAADLIGFDLAYAAQAKQRIAAATGMLPRQVVLAATHTHCGPLFYPMMMPGEPELEYAERLCERLAAVAVAARGGAVSGRVSFSRTRSGFGVNRRLPRHGKAVFAPNPDGPVDRDLDTLWFESEAGKLLATLTVYGCHATSHGRLPGRRGLPRVPLRGTAGKNGGAGVLQRRMRRRRAALVQPRGSRLPAPGDRRGRRRGKRPRRGSAGRPGFLASCRCGRARDRR